MPMKRNFVDATITAVVAVVIFSSASGVTAQDQPQTPASQTPADPAPAAPAAPAAPVLKGGVKHIELNLQLLSDFGLDLKKLLRSTNDLHDEVTIQPVSLMTQPELIGPGTIVYLPIATQATGAYIPPRKKRVDLAMVDINSIVTLMKEDADEALAGELQVDYPGDTKAELQPIIKGWVTSFEDMGSHLDKLRGLTAGPNYDNANIALECGAIHKITQDLDKSRRKVYKVVQKEGKRRKDTAT
jgi:hypothetical protein